jgi:hypothetical protein
MRCVQPPTFTVILRYREREVVIGDLLPDHDPNLLDLCSEHASRMSPPQGWTLVGDVRSSDVVAV